MKPDKLKSVYAKFKNEYYTLKATVRKPTVERLLMAMGEETPFAITLSYLRIAVVLSFLIFIVGYPIERPDVMTTPFIAAGYVFAFLYLLFGLWRWKASSVGRLGQVPSKTRDAWLDIAGDILLCSVLYWLTGDAWSAAFVFYLTPLLIVAHEWEIVNVYRGTAAVICAYAATAMLMLVGGPFFTGKSHEQFTMIKVISYMLHFLPRIGFYLIFMCSFRSYVMRLHSRILLSEEILSGIRSGISILDLDDKRKILYMNQTKRENSADPLAKIGMTCYQAYYDPQSTEPCWWCSKDELVQDYRCVTNLILDPTKGKRETAEFHLYQVNFGSLNWDKRHLVVKSAMDVTETIFEMGFLKSKEGEDRGIAAIECPVPVAVIDLRDGTRGTMLYLNRAMQKFFPQAKAGLKWEEPPSNGQDHFMRNDDLFEIVLDSGKSSKGLLVSKDPYGFYCHTMVTCVPLQNSKGEIHAAIEMFDDVTDRVMLSHLVNELTLAVEEVQVFDVMLQGFAKMLRVKRCTLTRVSSSPEGLMFWELDLRRSPKSRRSSQKIDFSHHEIFKLAVGTEKYTIIINQPKREFVKKSDPANRIVSVIGIDDDYVHTISEHQLIEQMLIIPIVVQGTVWAILTAQNVQELPSQSSGKEGAISDGSSQTPQTSLALRSLSYEEADVAQNAAKITGIVLESWIERKDRESALRHQLRGWPARVRQGVYELRDCLTSGGQEDIEGALRLLDWSALQCSTIMDTIVSASDIELGRLDLSLRPTNVWYIVEDLVKHYQPEAKSHRVTLVANKDPILPDMVVLADPGKLYLALHHLLQNAHDAVAVDGSGKIVLRLTKAEGRLILEVEDNGKGIDPAVEKMMFNRGLSTRGSTGIGLYVVNGIAKAHGWEIKARSNAGKGSVFTIVFTKEGEKRNE